MVVATDLPSETRRLAIVEFVGATDDEVTNPRLGEVSVDGGSSHEMALRPPSKLNQG